MVRIKHTTRPINVRVPSELESIACDKALEASPSRMEASVEVTASWSVEVSDNHESRLGSSEEMESAFNDSKYTKVAAAAGITFDFGASDIGKARIMSMENNAHYFLEGYLTVFSTMVNYGVVKITHSNSEVVLQTIKHIMIYPSLGPSLEAIALYPVV
jgi:hypothetical protein